MRKLTYCIVLLLCAQVAAAQPAPTRTVPFEGEIVYTVTATGDQSKPFRHMLPTHQKTWLKALCARTQTYGGFVNQTFVYDGFAGATYLLLADSQQAVAVPTVDVRPVVTREPEIVTIAGYRCQKYKVTQCAGRSYNAFVQYVWTTTELRTGVGGPQARGCYVFADVPGFPLKIQTPVTPDGEFDWTLTAQKVTPTCVDLADVLPPATYSKVPFNPNMPVVPAP
jgi:hypothetical protein